MDKNQSADRAAGSPEGRLSLRAASGRRWRRFLYALGGLLLITICLALLAVYRPFQHLSEVGTPAITQQVVLADLNGDGHLDAYVAIGHGSAPYPDRILFNDGTGRLSANTQPLSSWISFSVAAADLTGNGVADVLLDITGGGLVLFINQGHTLRQYSSTSPVGYLTEPGPKGVMRFRPVLGDLNGDGLLDIFAAGCCGRAADLRPSGGDHLLSYSLVWLNNGNGSFSPSRQVIGQMGSHEAALADLNGDGHLDVFLANGRTLDASGETRADTPNTVWFNDGTGQFQDSGQRLGEAESLAVALGDLNGDGFPDAVVGNHGPDEVWFNDGQGNFSDSGQRLGDGFTRSVFLADLNGDGHLDLFVSGQTAGAIWFNDGAGGFQPARQRIRYGSGEAVTLGDLNGDGHIGILVAGVNRYQIWHNDGNGRFTAGGQISY